MASTPSRRMSQASSSLVVRPVYVITSSSDREGLDETHSIEARAHDGSPTKLFLQDLLVLTRKLYLLPWLVLPLERATPLPGVPVHRLIRARDWLLLALLVPLEAVLLLLYAWAAVALPGWMSALIIAVTFALSLIHI